MTVCRYFLQGNCRFGDRCRFEHTETNYDTYDKRNRNQNQYDQQYSSRNAYQQDYNYGTQSGRYGPPADRYEAPSNRYGGQSEKYGGQSDRYHADYNARYSSNSHAYEEDYSYDRRSNYQSNEGSRYSNQNKDYGQGNYNKQYQRNYSASNQYSTNQQYGDTNRQSKYKWSHEDNAYKTPLLSDTPYPRDDYNADFTASTPKGGKSSFSFKVPESEIKKKSSYDELTQQDQLATDIVKADGKAWELGGLWPFSCYYPMSNKSGFPGFSDVSPEELRYAAYTAEKNSSFQSYTQAVQNVLEKVTQQISELQVPTPELINTLRQIWNGENLSKSDETLAFIPYLQCAPVNVVSSSSAFPAQNAAAAFSFKATTETDSVNSGTAAFSFKEPTEVKPAATAFSFKDPAAAAFSFKDPAAGTFSFKQSTEAKLSSFSFKLPSDTKTGALSSRPGDIYTPMELLTEEEMEQFQASTFVLGKIPTQPPPQVLCS